MRYLLTLLLLTLPFVGFSQVDECIKMDRSLENRLHCELKFGATIAYHEGEIHVMGYNSHTFSVKARNDYKSKAEYGMLNKLFDHIHVAEKYDVEGMKKHVIVGVASINELGMFNFVLLGDHLYLRDYGN